MAAVIAAVTMARNEADIIETSTHHLLDQGVDLVIVADHGSTDGTRYILDGLRAHTGCVEWISNDDQMYRQQHWMDLLARMASHRGAEWIVAWDVDEFWSGTTRTISDTIAWLAPDVNVLPAVLWHHQTWDDKVVPAESLSKVAYRWKSGARMAPGNHGVKLPDALVCATSLLEIRHLQYRSFEHFCRKVREQNVTLPPNLRQRGDGAHHTRLDGASDGEMREAWETLCGRETVHDPIPAQR